MTLTFVKDDNGKWYLDLLNAQNGKYNYLYGCLTITTDGMSDDGVLKSDWANPKKTKPTDAKAWTVTIDGLQPSLKYAVSLQCFSSDYGSSKIAKRSVTAQKFAPIAKKIEGFSTSEGINLAWTLNNTVFVGEILSYEVYWMKNKNTVGGTATITATETTRNGDFVFSALDSPPAGKKITFYLQQVRTIAFGDAFLTVKSAAVKKAITV